MRLRIGAQFFFLTRIVDNALGKPDPTRLEDFTPAMPDRRRTTPAGRSTPRDRHRAIDAARSAPGDRRRAIGTGRSTPHPAIDQCCAIDSARWTPPDGPLAMDAERSPPRHRCPQIDDDRLPRDPTTPTTDGCCSIHDEHDTPNAARPTTSTVRRRRSTHDGLPRSTTISGEKFFLEHCYVSAEHCYVE